MEAFQIDGAAFIPVFFITLFKLCIIVSVIHDRYKWPAMTFVILTSYTTGVLAIEMPGYTNY